MPRILPLAVAAMAASSVGAISSLNLRAVEPLNVPRRLMPNDFTPLGEIFGAPATSPRGHVEFGTSVKLSAFGGSRLAVGAPLHDWSTPDAESNLMNEDGGGVFLYEYDETDWNLVWFVAGNRHERIGDRISISADGSRVAVRRYNPNKAEVYDITSNSPAMPVGAMNGEDDGATINLSPDGSRIVVSSDRYNDFTGRVQIFEEGNGVWSPIGTIDGDTFHDRFGWMTAFSLSGDRLAVSAPNYDGGSTDRGLVRVYDYDSGSGDWIQVGGDIVGAARDDRFGFSMEMSGDGSTLIVASPNSDVNGMDSGKVSIYKLTNGSWELKGAEIGGVDADDHFGRAVAISEDGNRIAASSYLHDDRSGHVRVFEFMDGAWPLVGSELNGDDGTRLGFGLLSVSMSGDGLRLATGASRSENADGFSTGLVSIYEAPDRPSMMPTISPSQLPSSSPSMMPTASPSENPTMNPSASPSDMPTSTPTSSPTDGPTQSPTMEPTPEPSMVPTDGPTMGPSLSPSSTPTSAPTLKPSEAPSVSAQPSLRPSATPSMSPKPSSTPSESPTPKPSGSPTAMPSAMPSSKPPSVVGQANNPVDDTTSPATKGVASMIATIIIAAVGVAVF